MNPNIVEAGKKTRFKSGRSGNPAGRPRRMSITKLLSFILKWRPKVFKSVRPAIRAHFPEARTGAQAFVMATIIRAANKGNLATFREIREAVDGKTRYR